MSTLTTLVTEKTHTGDNATVAFTTTFQLTDEDQLKVYVDEVLQESGYTVSINSSTLVGTVTFSAAPATDAAILFRRVLPIDQPTNYIQLKNFPAPQHQETLNRIFMILQQLNTSATKTLQFAVTDTDGVNKVLPSAASRANKILGFDANGDITMIDPADYST